MPILDLESEPSLFINGKSGAGRSNDFRLISRSIGPSVGQTKSYSVLVVGGFVFVQEDSGLCAMSRQNVKT